MGDPPGRRGRPIVPGGFLNPSPSFRARPSDFGTPPFGRGLRPGVHGPQSGTTHRVTGKFLTACCTLYGRSEVCTVLPLMVRCSTFFASGGGGVSRHSTRPLSSTHL